MKRLSALIAATSLGLALVLGGPGDAWAQWRGGGWHGGGWHGGGWHGGGWHGGGWRGAGWRGGGWGWNRPGWNTGWRGGWAGGGWGWNRPGWNTGWRGGWAGGGWGWNRPYYGWRNAWWPVTAGLGLGWAATSPYWGSSWAWNDGWPYDSYYYGSTYGSPTYLGAYQAQPSYAYAQTAPLMTGRSVASGSIGMHCATSVKTCLLRNASYIGGGCSCRVTGGRARGAVTP
jgi:hypothetical protein